ncbi:MAG: alanine--tRNA ligase [Chloroflexi bacterium]|nr:alanine--tRNA ligase [Chloroflexota bacterium]MCY3583172.1 alanine--tRNA ligase [Chloroflexota bacterium]MCY3716056.1 alanine--tRNA ligase [Chloroflexota bacterium]MDE2651377.1 alanine--tRNA ligase [Chloroflexota bacterium]MYA93002.1 alanine--tRNA ligase [Chloroflexota bacterium]
MKSMSSAEVRQAFLDFFEEMNHRPVASSSLVPADDPTLLFVNAGMVQFKDVFLGLDKRNYSRAATSQKCMRVSGKHNDLENVGPSLRHHTFFEMLGNFSFGDYFKRDAIRYAYTLLTKVFELPPERLVYTVYANDDEAYSAWVDDMGIDPKRVARMGPDTNFWQMADTGPCGPTSEIHWDKQPQLGEDNIIPQLQAEDERFLEIWNLVFMQFNRQQPDPQHSGAHDVPLPAPGVDTGLGLERIVSILQGVEANYETDLFMPIIQRAQELTGQSDAQRDANIVPYRVIADHARAAVFLISDGVSPGAKGRAAIPRIVIRRAARFGNKLGFDRPFLAEIAQAVIDNMGEHYQELLEQADSIKHIITLEEERFHRTMQRGLNELDNLLERLEDGGKLSGERAFYLKATLGLPFQVTRDVVEERGYTVDEAGFFAAEAEHARISGGGQAMGEIESGEAYATLLADLQAASKLPETGVDYDPYGDAPIETTVLALLQDGREIETAIAGEKVEIVLKETNFYVESGGQVSDTGSIRGEDWEVEVDAMKQPVAGLVVHAGEVLEGSPSVNDRATASVDRQRRRDIIRNHSATHLLHAALRNQLGAHVQQKGSLVAPERLRFDFSHHEKVAAAQLTAISAEINRVIVDNYAVRAQVKALEQARREGAMALFGEKYGDEVRAVAIESAAETYSYELCGGAHVAHTAEIGSFVFTSEGSVSAGIRRVEALTGHAAARYLNDKLDTLSKLVEQLGAAPGQALGRLQALQAELIAERRESETLRRKLAKSDFDAMLTGGLETINGRQALLAQLDSLSMEALREMADWFRNRVDRGVMVLASDNGGKPQIIVAVSDALVKEGARAGDLIKPIARVVGGGGGGRPHMAQAGGRDSSKIPEALQKARELIASGQ